MAELEWSVVQIKTLEQLTLLASTFRALELIEQLQGLTWASHSAIGKPTYPLGYVDESIFLKQASFCPNSCLQMPHIDLLIPHYKMSIYCVFKEMNVGIQSLAFSLYFV